MTGRSGVGRPRKWASNAERMRAYRARQRDRDARLVDPADAPRTVADNQRLRQRIAELTDERDRLWAQIVSLQLRLRDLERVSAGAPTVSSLNGTQIGLPRAERRRLEREQARRRQ
jgi:hypothetical protein